MCRGVAALSINQMMRIGKVGEPISIGGVDIHANDIVLCDEHGSVVVRRHHWPDILEMCETIVKQNKKAWELIRSGKPMTDRHLRAEHKVLDSLAPAEEATSEPPATPNPLPLPPQTARKLPLDAAALLRLRTRSPRWTDKVVPQASRGSDTET